MRKSAGRSILTMVFVMVILALFAWHFNRKMETLKKRSEPPIETDLLTTSSEDEAGSDAQKIESGVLGVKAQPILACFCADWSPSCKQMNELLSSLEKSYRSRLHIRIIDPSEEAEIAKQFKINELPTIFVFDAQGELVFRRAGAMTEDQLRSVLKRIGLEPEADSPDQAHQ